MCFLPYTIYPITDSHFFQFPHITLYCCGWPSSVINFSYFQYSKTFTLWFSWASLVCWHFWNDTASALWDLHYCSARSLYNGPCFVRVFIDSAITIKSNWELKGKWKLGQFFRKNVFPKVYDDVDNSKRNRYTLKRK